MSPHRITINFTSGKNKLVGNLILPDRPNLGVLFLHGGEKSTKERFLELQELLHQENIASLAFDFQGVGESSGNFVTGSLNNRLRDAQTAFDKLQKYVKNIVVVGSSMGGHLSLRLTGKRKATGLILLYAAAYSKASENLALNETFTAELRKPASWKDSSAFRDLKNFLLPALVIYGEKDIVIPKDIQQTYQKNLNRQSKFVLLKEGAHLLLSPENEEEKQAKEQTYKEIIKFIKAL